MSDLFYGLFQQRSRNDLMDGPDAPGPLSLAGLAGGVALTHSLLPGIAAMAATGALVVLFHDAPAAKALSDVGPRLLPSRWDRRVLGRLALLSARSGW